MSTELLFTAAIDETINLYLRSEIHELALALLDTPTYQTNHEMSWGDTADIVVRTSGKLQGQFIWQSHGAYGAPLALIIVARNLNRAASRHFAFGGQDAQP